MTDPARGLGPESLGTTLIRRCMRYEADRGEGREPDLRDYLTGLSEAQQVLLLRVLLPLHFKRLRDQGVTPELEDYDWVPGGPDAARRAYSQADRRTPVGAEPPTTGPPPLPEFIGRYRVEEVIDAGGQATVYKAVDPELGRGVAIKVSKDPLVGDRTDRDWLAAEGKHLAKLEHPNLIRVYDWGVHEGCVFLVMEYVEGDNLQRLANRQGVPAQRTAELVAGAARGAAAAHRENVIHRDIKPGNILVEKETGRPKLIDFGLAFQEHGWSDALIESPGGTYAYMAPEQARLDDDRIGPCTDVFALGGVLYFLLTGRHPFGGASPAEALDRVERCELDRGPLKAERAPKALVRICLKAMSAEPKDRYATADELARDLAWFVERSRRFATAVAAVVACGIFALAFWFWPRDGGIGPPPLQAEFSLALFKDSGDGKSALPIGTISKESLHSHPPRLKDLVQVQVMLSRPAYGYLIALNPDGKDQLCVPASASPRRDLDFSEDRKKYFSLTDGVGLQAFVAVISDRPLPAYDSWRTKVPGGLSWSPTDREGLWTYDSSEPSSTDRLRKRARGAIVDREADPEGLKNLCERLRQSPGVRLVHAVAFPVKPDVEIMK